MADLLTDACVRASNAVKDARDTATVLRLALAFRDGGLSEEEVAALHHVAGRCEFEAEAAVKAAAAALALAEGRDDG